MDKNATFYQKLTAFYHNKGISFEYEPRIGGTKLSLEKVYELVQNMGGSSKVSDQNKWADIFEQCGSLPSSCVNGHFLMKQIYSRYLDAFERHERGEGSDETNTGFGNTNASIDDDSCNPYTRSVTYNNNNNMASSNYTRNIFPPMIVNSHQALDVQHKYQQQKNVFAYKVNPYKYACHRLRLSLLSPFPNEVMFALEFLHGLSQAECAMNELQHLTTQLQLQQQMLTIGNKDALIHNHYQELILQYKSLNRLLHGNQKLTSVSNQPAAPDLNVYYTFLIDIFKGVVAQQQKIAPDQVTSIPSYYAFLNTCGQIKMLDAVIETVLPAELFVETPFDQEDLNINSSKTVKDNNNLGTTKVGRIANDPFYMAIKQFWKHQIDSTTKDLALCPSTDNNSILIRLAIVIDIIRNWSFLPGNGHAMANNITCIRFLIVICRACKLSADFINSTQDIVSNISKYMDLSSLSKQDPRITKLFLTIFLDGTFDNRFLLTRSLEIYGNLCYQPEQNMSHLLMHLSDEVCQQIIQQLLRDSDVAVLCRTLETLYQITFYGKDTLNDRIANVTGSIDILINLLKFKSSSQAITKMNISFPIRVEQKVQTNNNTYMPPSQQAKFLKNKNNNQSQSLHYQPQRVGPPSRPSSQLAMLQQSNPQGAPLMFQSQNMTSNANAFHSNPILIGLEAGTGDHHTPQSKDLNATKKYYQNDLKHTFSINTHLAVGNNNNLTQTLLTTPNNINLPADRLLANRMGDGPSHHLNHHFGLSSQKKGSCRSNRDILREVGYSKSNRVKRHPMPQNIESPGAFNHNISHYNSNAAAKLNESTYSASTPLSVKQEENVSIDSDSRDQTSIVNTPQKFARNSDGGGNLFKTPTNSSPGVRSLGSSGGSAQMFGRSYNSGSERSVKHSSPSISFSANNKLHFEAARYAERWFRAYYEPGPGLTPRAEMLNCYFTYGRRFFRESFRPLKYTSLCNCIKRALPSGKLIRRIRDNGQLQVLVEGIRKRAVPLPLDKVPQLTPQEYSLNLKKRSASPCTMRDDELYGDKITDEKIENDLNITTSPHSLNAGGHIIKDAMPLENYSKLPLLGGTSSQDLSSLPKIKEEMIFDSSCNESNFDARQYQQQTPPYPNPTMHGDRDSVLLPINHIPSNIVSPFSLQAQTLVVGDNIHSTCSNTSVSQRGRPKKVMKSAVTNPETTIDLNGTSHQSTNSLGGNSEPVRKHHGRPKGAFGVRKRRLLESLDPNSPEYKKIQQGNLKFRKQSLDHIGKTLPLADINKNLVNGSSSQLSDETSSSLKTTLCSEQPNKAETSNSLDSNPSASCISQNIVDQTLSISTVEQCAKYTDSTNNSSILTSTNSTVSLFAETHSINVTSSSNATNYTGMSTQLAIDKTNESTLKISIHSEIKENIITNGCHNNSSLNHSNTLLVNTTQIETTNDEDSSNALLTDFPLLQARLQTNRTTTLFSTNSTSLSLVSNITRNIGSPITSTNQSDVSTTKKSDTQLLDKILGFNDSKSPSTTHRQVDATEAKEMLEEQPMDIDIDINETVDSISTTLVHSPNNKIAKDTRDINYNTSIQVSEQNGDISPDNVKETNLEDHGTEYLNHSDHSTHQTASSKAKINSGPQNSNAYPGINIEESGTDAMELDMEVMTSSTNTRITDDISPTNRVKQNGLNQNDEQSYHTISTDDTFQNTTCSHIIEDKPKENCNIVSIVSQLAETPANPSSSDSEKTCGRNSIYVPAEKILKESPKQHFLNGLILPHYKVHKTHLEKVTHIHHVSLSSHTSTQQIPDQKVLISNTKNIDNVSKSMENRDISKNDYNIVTSVIDSILDNICNLPTKSFNADGIDGIETKDDIRLDPIKAYQCAWGGCERKALTPQSLIAHIYFDHATVPESSINESLNNQIHSNMPTVCLWRNCNQNYMGKYFTKTPQQQQLITRQKYSLANHLLETHCTPAQIAKLELCITDQIEIQNILSNEKSNASHLKYEMNKETKYGPPDQAAIQTMYRYFAQSLSNTPYLAEELGLNIGKTNDVEYNLNLNVRYMAALVLRNIAVNSPRVGQRKIKLYEHVLVSQAFTPTDISKIISQILWEIQSNSLSRHIDNL